MRVIDCVQGEAEWLQARCGLITASRIADVLDTLKNGGEGAKRRNYRMELLAERLSGRAEEHYVSRDMEHGTEWEPHARTAYELDRGVMVDTVGFVLHPTLDFAGASPDGLIGADGGLEIKCPRTTTHLKWMLEGKVPEEHEPQMVWEMACCGRQWWDFVSYDPRLPEGLRLFTVRLERNEERIRQIEQAVIQFHGEIEGLVEPLRDLIVQTPHAEEDRTRLEGSDYLDSLMDVVGAEIVP